MGPRHMCSRLPVGQGVSSWKAENHVHGVHVHTCTVTCLHTSGNTSRWEAHSEGASCPLPLALKLVPECVLPHLFRCPAQPCDPSPGSGPSLTLPAFSHLGFFAAFLVQCCLQASSLVLERTLLTATHYGSTLHRPPSLPPGCSVPAAGQHLHVSLMWARAPWAQAWQCHWAGAVPEHSR